MPLTGDGIPTAALNSAFEITFFGTTSDQGERELTSTIPPAIPKHELISDMLYFEDAFEDQTKTLTQFFTHQVTDVWNVDELSSDELLAIRNNLAYIDGDCLIVLRLDLRNHPRLRGEAQ